MSELSVYVLRLTFEAPVGTVSSTIVAAGESVAAVVAEYVSDIAAPLPDGSFFTPEPAVELLAVTDALGLDYDLIDQTVVESP